MRKEKFGEDLWKYLQCCKEVAHETNKSVIYMFNGCVNNIPFSPATAKAYRKLLSALAESEAATARVMSAYEELEECC